MTWYGFCCQVSVAASGESLAPVCGAIERSEEGGRPDGVTEDIGRPCGRHADPRWLRNRFGLELAVRERNEQSAQRVRDFWIGLDQPADLIGQLLRFEPPVEQSPIEQSPDKQSTAEQPATDDGQCDPQMDCSDREQQRVCAHQSGRLSHLLWKQYRLDEQYGQHHEPGHIDLCRD